MKTHLMPSSLSDYMRLNNYNITEIAFYLDVTSSQVYYYLSKRNKLSKRVLKKLCELTSSKFDSLESLVKFANY